MKRNRVKRQIREAYRLNKHLLIDALPPGCPPVAVAFIYLSDEVSDSALIDQRMKAALARVADNVTASSSTGVFSADGSRADEAATAL